MPKESWKNSKQKNKVDSRPFASFQSMKQDFRKQQATKYNSNVEMGIK